MSFIIYVFKISMNIIYAFLKLFPAKKQVCFFSRQSDTLPIDFELLIEKIKETDDDIGIKVICNRFRYFSDGPIHFSLNQLRSMYLSTSKVCILDAYWPTVSMLKHKKSLTVIQIWHSIGKIKQSGYQTVNKAGGRNADIARIMCMHKNYDYVIAGGEAWNQYYCQAFNIEEDKILNYGLPRLDLIMKEKKKENLLLEKYPELQGKIIVFFAPTYRKYEIDAHEKLKALFDSDKYAFIWKLHPNQRSKRKISDVFNRYQREDTFKLLQICDYFITDYSSLALEAALLDKKTIYYLFDYERYQEENGLNINLFEFMPNCTFSSAENVFEAIDEKEYPYGELQKYKEEFLPKDLGVSTKKIVNTILNYLC